LFAFRVIPCLLFGVVAGPLSDRGHRPRVIIGGNLMEGVLVATIPIAHVFGVLTVAQVYVVVAPFVAASTPPIAGPTISAPDATEPRSTIRSTFGVSTR
jgi:hypothetical protein